MSLKQNNEWLEAAVLNFEESLLIGNYELCQAIIEDVADAGFLAESRHLKTELLDAKIDDLLIPSPYQHE